MLRPRVSERFMVSSGVHGAQTLQSDSAKGAFNSDELSSVYGTLVVPQRDLDAGTPLGDHFTLRHAPSQTRTQWGGGAAVAWHGARPDRPAPLPRGCVSLLCSRAWHGAPPGH